MKWMEEHHDIEVNYIEGDDVTQNVTQDVTQDIPYPISSTTSTTTSPLRAMTFLMRS